MKIFFLLTLSLTALINCSNNPEKEKSYTKGSISIRDIFDIHATKIALDKELMNSISITYTELLGLLSPENKKCFLDSKGGQLEKEMPENVKNNSAFFQKTANNKTYKMLDFKMNPSKEKCSIKQYRAFILYTLNNEKLFAVCAVIGIGDKVFPLKIEEMGRFSDYGVSTFEELTR